MMTLIKGLLLLAFFGVLGEVIYMSLGAPAWLFPVMVVVVVCWMARRAGQRSLPMRTDRCGLHPHMNTEPFVVPPSDHFAGSDDDIRRWPVTDLDGPPWAWRGNNN